MSTKQEEPYTTHVVDGTVTGRFSVEEIFKALDRVCGPVARIDLSEQIERLKKPCSGE